MNSTYRKSVLLFFLVLNFWFAGISQITFRNPIISGLASDPSICRVGDDYYLVTSTFEYFPGLPIYQSKDLVHWKIIGYALHKASQNPLMGCDSGTGGQYAPTIRYNNGIFYVVCTNYGGQGSKGAFYVTATNPAGPWSEPHWTDNWGVDPSLLFANDSIYYTHPAGCDGYFMQATLNLKTGKFNKPERKLANGTGGACPEGPHMYKLNDKYYLMAAEGGTGYGHMETMQRSDSPWGPFVKSPINPIVSHKDDPGNPFQAIGHADLVETPDGWWLVCLGFRTKGGNYHHLGRETFLAPVTWNANGWPKVMPDGIVKQEMTAPNLPQYIWPADPVRDGFDKTSLRLDWNFVRNPGNFWSLTDKAGSLQLKGSSVSFKEKLSPAFIGRRQTAFNLLTSTKINFVSTAENEEAGLVVRGNDANHFDFLITTFAGKRMVMLRQFLSGKTVGLNYREIPDGEIILRISATDLEYQFWVQQEGKTAELIGTTLTKNMSTEVIGGFTGTFIGMYASGNGKNSTNPAYFDWFDFEENPQMPFAWTTGTPPTQNNMETPSNVVAVSSAFDQIKITWNDIQDETGYIIERYDNSQFVEVGSTDANITTFTDKGLTGSTLYIYRISGKNDLGKSLPSVTSSALTLPTPGPYSGKATQIPGKLEVEDYDIGLAGIVFSDSDTGNSGGKYRSDNVDIESCSDTGTGYDIGWTNAGEWLIYTVDVNDTIVDIDFRVGSSYGGKAKLELDNRLIGEISFTATGGWQTWKTFSLKKVKLTAGKNRKLKLTISQAGFNINWISFSKSSTVGIQTIDSQGLKVYPIPAKNELFIESNEFQYDRIEIFDMTGKLIQSKQVVFEQKKRLDLSLPNGIYCLKISNKEQLVTRTFIIK
jgi:alpha-N-arabinofuranosidase